MSYSQPQNGGGSYGEGDENVLMIAIKLSDKQIETIQQKNLDLKYIEGLQNLNTYPRKNPDVPIYKFGNNFENAVYVGVRNFRNKTPQPVFLKNDGWFTTPNDLTNCSLVKDVNGNIVKTEKGYQFDDASQVLYTGVLRQQLDQYDVPQVSEGAQGGKSRKYKKRKLKSKSKRRYKR